MILFLSLILTSLLLSLFSVLDFPTFPGSDIPIPNSADFKYYANIFPSIAEPRVSFTLALPFKTSPLIHTYKRDALKKQIRFLFIYLFIFTFINVNIYISLISYYILIDWPQVNILYLE